MGCLLRLILIKLNGEVVKKSAPKITDISHSVFNFEDGLTMSQHPCPSHTFLYDFTLYTKDICTQSVGCVFWWIFCIVLLEDGFIKIVNYVSPEYSPAWKFQPAKELLIDLYYFKYCSFVLCVFRAPEDKPRLVDLYIVWSFHAC